MIKQTHTQRKASPSSQIIQRVPLSGKQTDWPPFGCGVHRIHARNSFHVRVKAKGNQGSCCCAVYLKRPVIAQLTLKYLPSFKNISLHSYLQMGGSRCLRLSSALSFEKRSPLKRQTNARKKWRCSGFQNCPAVHICWA